MEKAPGVKSAVEGNEIVVACVYGGSEHESLATALPQGFQGTRYVAKFVNGQLVALESGRPEDAIQRLLGKSAPDCKSCVDATCEDCTPPEVPRQ